MKKEEFCYDGTAKIFCRKCRTLHEVAFDGTDEDLGVEESIERGMDEAGWDSANRLCPNCWEEFEESEEDKGLDPDYDIEFDDNTYDDIDEEEL